MKTITFLNEKGGVGKTTLTTHLAALMAVSGLRVLLVDMAPQAHATVSFGLKKQGCVYDWLVRETELKDVIRQPPDMSALAIPGQPVKGQLYILPGNAETVGIPAQVDMYALQTALQFVAKTGQIDLVLMDTDPATSSLVSLVYMASDAIVIPTQADSLSIDGLVTTVQRVQNFPHKEIRIMGIATNFYDDRTLLHRKNYTDLVRAGQSRNWSIWTPIKMRTAFREASNLRRMVYTLDTNSATAAARDLFKVASQFREALAAV